MESLAGVAGVVVMLEDQGHIQQNYSEITLRLLTMFTDRNASLLGTVLHRELQP
jgi:hypothetical protein